MCVDVERTVVFDVTWFQKTRPIFWPLFFVFWKWLTSAAPWPRGQVRWGQICQHGTYVTEQVILKNKITRLICVDVEVERTVVFDVTWFQDTRPGFWPLFFSERDWQVLRPGLVYNPLSLAPRPSFYPDDHRWQLALHKPILYQNCVIFYVNDLYTESYPCTMCVVTFSDDDIDDSGVPWIRDR